MIRRTSYQQACIGMFVAYLSICVLSGCTKRSTSSLAISSQDSVNIMNDVLAYRAEADAFFRNDPDSPFNKDTTVHYEGIKWFTPDVRLSFRSLLYRYDHPEPVVVLGTKGEERSLLKYGYFIIPFEGKEHHLNVYKSHEDGNHLSIWFTDETTGKETYEVGRYLNISDEHLDSQYLYTMNFNNAYNPYCSYSALYSCAIPRREDHLAFAVRAGEMKYHH